MRETGAIPADADHDWRSAGARWSGREAGWRSMPDPFLAHIRGLANIRELPLPALCAVVPRLA